MPTQSQTPSPANAAQPPTVPDTITGAAPSQPPCAPDNTPAASSQPTPQPEPDSPPAADADDLLADIVSEDMWNDLLRTNMTVIDPLPKHLVTVYAEAKCESMRQLLESHPTEEDAVQAWLCLLLFDKLVAHTKTDPHVSLNITMRLWLRQAADGEWYALVADALDRWADRGPRQPTSKSGPFARVARRVETLVCKGSYSKAAQTALSPARRPAAPEDRAKLLAEITLETHLCPQDTTPIHFDEDQFKELQYHNVTLVVAFAQPMSQPRRPARLACWLLEHPPADNRWGAPPQGDLHQHCTR